MPGPNRLQGGAEGLALRAGALSARLIDGELRNIRLWDRELVRRVAVVVRDSAWGTLDNEEVDAAPVQTSSGFSVRVSGRCERGEIVLDWIANISSRAGTTLDCDLELVPRKRFEYNRMGLILLHPLSRTAGCAFSAGLGNEDTRGLVAETVDPQPIVDGLPQPVLGPFDRLELFGPEGETTRFSFKGDLFETEDQRNWADGSFKTYAMPLGRGFPLSATGGQPIKQAVRIEFEEPPSTGRARAATGRADTAGNSRRGPSPVTVAVGRRCGYIPALGTSLPIDSAADQPLAAAARDQLQPRYLRVDLDEADSESPLLGSVGGDLPLEIALSRTDAAERLEALPKAVRSRAARILLLDEATVGVAVARRLLPGVPVIGGSTGQFAEVNRGQLDQHFDGLAFSLSPQTHLFDDDTLRESLESLESLARTARQRSGGKPLHIGPLTLRPQRGPGSEPRRGSPAGTDPRQLSSLARAWLLGSIAELGIGGASTITAFELYGPRSCFDPAGEHRDVAETIGALSRLEGLPLARTSISEPTAVAALAYHIANEVRVQLANLTNREQRVHLLDFDRRDVLAPGDVRSFSCNGFGNPGDGT